MDARSPSYRISPVVEPVFLRREITSSRVVFPAPLGPYSSAYTHMNTHAHMNTYEHTRAHRPRPHTSEHTLRAEGRYTSKGIEVYVCMCMRCLEDCKYMEHNARWGVIGTGGPVK
eukprot:8757543-Pyramimonas_sp.AAC.1